MQKSDYRRELIMLRSMQSGYTGHARLEQRTLMGDLYVVISAPQPEDLRGVLACPGRNGWHAAEVCAMRTDPRGQISGRFHYDPRAVSGREMDAYTQLLAVRPRDGSIVLAGNLKGGAADWTAMQEAVRALYVRADPVPELKWFESPPEEQQETPEAVSESAAPEEPVPDEPDGGTQAASEENADVSGETDGDEPEPKEAEDDGVPEADGFIFVRVPVPCTYGPVRAAIGLRREDDRITGVCYAVSGSRQAEPPAGMEDYVWTDCPTGGWWISCLDISPAD